MVIFNSYVKLPEGRSNAVYLGHFWIHHSHPLPLLHFDMELRSIHPKGDHEGATFGLYKCEHQLAQ